MRKKIVSTFFAGMLFFFMAACDDGEVYSDTGNTGDTADTGDTSDSGNTADTGDTADEDVSDTGDTVPDADSDDPDTDAGDDDTYIPPVGSCEEILYCEAGCADFDDNCFILCVTYGDDDGQQDYNNWRDCYDTKCASEKTAVCSERECPTESEACAISSEKPEPQPFPAPYGNVNIEGDFDFIVEDGFPAGDSELVYEPFVVGKLSKIRVDSQVASFLFSFVNLTNDGTDDILQVIQIPMMQDAKTIVNPISRLTMKMATAAKGTYSIGIEGGDALLEVFHITDEGDTVCHYAFGMGTYTIEEINPVAGNEGILKISGESIDLYSPRNFEKKGDVSELLDVVSCSLIK